MATVAFAFGSFGDIVALVQLALQVAKALSDTRGSSAEWQALADDIQSFSELIATVHGFLNARGHPNLAGSALIDEHIRQTAARCRKFLEEMVLKLNGYQLSLQEGGSERRIRDWWRKLRWLFSSERKDVVDLQRRLALQLASMHMLLSLLHFPHLDLILSAGVELNGQMLNEILESIQRLRLSRELGYPWEGDAGPADQSIRLFDFLDRIILLPLQLCATREGLHVVLQIYYKDRLGQ